MILIITISSQSIFFIIVSIAWDSRHSPVVIQVFQMGRTISRLFLKRGIIRYGMVGLLHIGKESDNQIPVDERTGVGLELELNYCSSLGLKK